MQTELAEQYRHTPEGQEAEAILRRCVHCGFCTATCPTYQILGDELDGPRGRIYQIKQVLEGQPATATTQLHLDRCLTCRNCETTCPSGVEYGRLIDIGRKLVDEQVPRSLVQGAVRGALKVGLTSSLFGPAFKLGQMVRPLLPGVLKNKVPASTPALHHSTQPLPAVTGNRKVIMLAGCVQPAMQPNINVATQRVLQTLGIAVQVAAEAGCCGAIRHHLNDHEGALQQARNNVDAWWPLVQAGAEAIIMNASGCGSMVKDYAHLLRHEAAYAEKASRISSLTQDLAEFLPTLGSAIHQRIAQLGNTGKVPQATGLQRLTYHPPCTLQHGQQVRGNVEILMRELGFTVSLPADSHLCCGSAGTYSVLQSELATNLRDRKLTNIAPTEPQMIVSANIGCITHLQSGTHVPVRHWIEVLDLALSV